LPEPLFQRAKLAALQRRQTLKELFAEVLESALNAEAPTPDRMTEPPIRLNLRKPIPALSNRKIAARTAEDDAAKFPAK
jgi:hypothetical protein